MMSQSRFPMLNEYTIGVIKYNTVYVFTNIYSSVHVAKRSLDDANL